MNTRLVVGLASCFVMFIISLGLITVMFRCLILEEYVAFTFTGCATLILVELWKMAMNKWLPTKPKLTK
jgi:hypothetical protein